MNYQDTYSPIDPDFYDILDPLIKEHKSGKVFYFNPQQQLDEVSGTISAIKKTPEGAFLEINNECQVRLDKVITVFGKPGPAYDTYDRFGNVCLSCEDLGQF